MENLPNAPIARGDVVILKSGGPRMVIEAMEVHAAENIRIGNPVGTAMARCLWHDSAGEIQNHMLPMHLLVADPETAKRKADERAADEKRAAELSKEASKDADARRAADEKRAADLSKKAADDGKKPTAQD